MERPLYHEPWARMIGRRVVSTTVMILLALLYLLVLPALLLVAVAHDLAKRRPWISTRCALMLGAHLGMHVVGLPMMVGAPLLGGFDAAARARWQLRAEVWWARSALRIVMWAFGMSLEVRGLDEAGPGPLIIFPRHTSILDTLLPMALLGERHGLHLRYVMKHILLWDPCIDAVGHREPTAFVRRGTRDHAREIAKVEHLMDALGPLDGVVIYPEGTRFTPEKKARRLAKLAERDPSSHARAARLRHLLAPHLGGPSAVLAREPPVDVLVLAHTGLEGANHLQDFLDGTLLGARIEVEMWRVPAADIPHAPDTQLDWLYDQWEWVDAWIDARRPAR